MTDPRYYWLQKQIKERSAAAKAVKDGYRNWRAEPPDKDGIFTIVAVDAPYPKDPANVIAAVQKGDKGAVGHIARNDPRQVLASCTAELAILHAHKSSGPPVSEKCIVCKTGYLCLTIQSLYYSYQHRPGWRPW